MSKHAFIPTADGRTVVNVSHVVRVRIERKNYGMGGGSVWEVRADLFGTAGADVLKAFPVADDDDAAAMAAAQVWVSEVFGS